MVLAQVHRLKLIYFFLEDRQDPFPENLIMDFSALDKCLNNDNREQILQDYPKTWPMDMSKENEVCLLCYFETLTRR